MNDDRVMIYILVLSMLLLAVAATLNTVENGFSLMTVNYVLFGGLLAFVLHIFIGDLEDDDLSGTVSLKQYVQLDQEYVEAKEERDLFKWMLEQVSDPVPTRIEIVAGEAVLRPQFKGDTGE